MLKKSSKKASKKLFDYLGWAAVGILLFNYLLLSNGIISGTSYAYQLMSLLGCSFIIVEALHKKDLQPVALNFIFALIAVITIIRISFFL